LKLIIGLGNPGKKYELTRHNIGYQILDYIADYLKVNIKPAKDNWYGASGKFRENDFYLMKPTTFMNNSGEAVLDFLTGNNIPLKNILVVYDDFQIPLGMIRLKTNGSDGGHNGISSIIYHLNTMSFPRMRIGIGKDTPLNKEDYIDFVLSDFCTSEIKILNDLFPIFKDCILSYISEDIAVTMNHYNKMFLKKDLDNDIKKTNSIKKNNDSA
jgi:peptidyl-tRNA hydrolase, PTH1 family